MNQAMSNDNQNSIEQFFYIKDNVLTPSLCERAITLFESSEHRVQGKIGNGTYEGAYRPDIKDTTEVMMNSHPKVWTEILDPIVETLKTELKNYLELFPGFIQVPIYPEEFRLAKYEIGGAFDWHSDNIGNDITRIITVIWYLNTVEEGGETHYKYQNVKVKPVTGRMTLCPVGWPFVHKGEPPVSNSKYMIITQLHQQLPDAVAN